MSFISADLNSTQKQKLTWMNSLISVRLFKEARLLLKFARPISEHLGLSSFRRTSDKNLLLQDNKLEVSLLKERLN